MTGTREERLGSIERGARNYRKEAGEEIAQRIVDWRENA